MLIRKLFFYLALLVLLWGMTACNDDVTTLYEELNPPLGLSIATYEEGYLLQFYAYNLGKVDFAGYAFFASATEDQSRLLYQISDALFTFTYSDYANLINHNVNTPIQIKTGSVSPADSSIFLKQVSLTPGQYLTVRAYPVYDSDRPDNTDPLLGPAISTPSNTVQIP